jgi:hypothetical protein
MSGSNPRWYDDAQFGVRERLDFYPHQASVRLSGDKVLVKRYYPKGPIKILKFGIQHRATQGGTEVTVNLKRNSSTLATLVASTDSAPWAIASKSVGKYCRAGSYLVVDTAGTVASGSVMCFIEFQRIFHPTKWDTSRSLRDP